MLSATRLTRVRRGAWVFAEAAPPPLAQHLANAGGAAAADGCGERALAALRWAYGLEAAWRGDTQAAAAAAVAGGRSLMLRAPCGFGKTAVVLCGVAARPAGQVCVVAVPYRSAAGAWIAGARRFNLHASLLANGDAAQSLLRQMLDAGPDAAAVGVPRVLVATLDALGGGGARGGQRSVVEQLIEALAERQRLAALVVDEAHALVEACHARVGRADNIRPPPPAGAFRDGVSLVALKALRGLCARQAHLPTVLLSGALPAAAQGWLGRELPADFDAVQGPASVGGVRAPCSLREEPAAAGAAAAGVRRRAGAELGGGGGAAAPDAGGRQLPAPPLRHRPHRRRRPGRRGGGLGAGPACGCWWARRWWRRASTAPPRASPSAAACPSPSARWRSCAAASTAATARAAPAASRRRAARRPTATCAAWRSGPRRRRRGRWLCRSW